MKPFAKFSLTLSAALVLSLSACEMPRDVPSNDIIPQEEVAPPPTLVPLGAETIPVVEAEPSPIPTVINVQPITEEAASVELEAIVENGTQLTATSETIEVVGVNTDADQAAIVEEPLVVDALESALAEEGAPLAANPPPSETVGDYSGTTTHEVRVGDTLFGLSVQYNVSPEAIRVANSMRDDVVRLGQSLIIPPSDEGYAPDVPDTAPPVNDGYHVVVQGDTLFSIAASYNSSAETLANLNGINFPYTIYAGQHIVLPNITGGQTEVQPSAPAIAGTHTVAAGETLYSIASRYGVSADGIAAANGLSDPNQIYVGQVLYLP